MRCSTRPALPRSLALAAALAAATLWAAPVHAATVTPFASGLAQSLYSITTDGSALYFTGATGVLRNFNGDPTNGVVAKISLSGGGASTLYSTALYASASGHLAPFQITVDAGGNLYWADPDAGPGTGASVIKGSTTGAVPVQIFGICCGESVLPGDGVGLAASGGHLYFSDATGGRIGVDPSGSSATQIGATRYAPNFNTAQYTQIAVSNGKIFIADSAELRAASATGKAAVWDQSAFITPGVRWISVDGSSGFVNLSVGKIDHPRGLVVNGNFLYVTSAKAVWKVNKNSGATTLLAKDKRFKDLQGITFANGAFYVLDSQTKFGPPVGTVKEALTDGPGKIWKIVP